MTTSRLWPMRARASCGLLTRAACACSLLVLGIAACGKGSESTSASRTRYVVEFTDATGEDVAIDLERITLTFDKSTGDYTIRVTATTAKPFTGFFRVSVNLYNPTGNPGGGREAFFEDNLRDITLTAPSTTVEFGGNDSKLTSWTEGQQVAADSYPGFGVPPNSGIFGFSSGVSPLPFLTGTPDGTAGAIGTVRTAR